ISQSVRGSPLIFPSRCVSILSPGHGGGQANGPGPHAILPRVAIALLLTTGLALLGFVATSVGGFSVASSLAAHLPAAGALVRHHFLLALPTMLLSLFAQTMVIFYFIGTGRLIKDDVAGYPEPERAVILGALRRFKARTSPVATFSLLSAIVVFVLGG